MDEIDYGKLTKRIVFTENDHRQAKLLVRCKYDNLSQSDFFRHIVTGYINGDERIQSYIDEVKNVGKIRRQKSQILKKGGKQQLEDFALSVGEVENIFDLLEEEFPEL
ncbi:hypothetical protein CMI47_08040 [Candidatus Pacearchaeota archaeon]|nr:hypothetical protein [Candidatus Pacearchaeota archaeon]